VSLLAALYVSISVLLSIYGLNAFVLILAALKGRRALHSPPALSRVPSVTVQLPVYNERHVVVRAIESLAALDWPADRLQIQVLDDSTDDTVVLVDQAVNQARDQGIDITVLRRAQRDGYKAGALNAALESARGELIAIFDADFCPGPDFLQRTVPYLMADPTLGFVQARWEHFNDMYSPLTLAQAIALDGHFAVEHIARENAGWLTNFSGTGGIWRKRCIQECGGWDPEVLTEDIDLSYRAQLAGWRGRTLPDVVAPAELPAQIDAFKGQQFRWAKGNTQCLIKQLALLLRARLSAMARIQAMLHLGYYSAHPLMLLILCLSLPVIWWDALDHWALACLSVATLGPPTLYAIGQFKLYKSPWKRIAGLPALILLGTGLAFNSSVAVVEALLGIKSAFQRTPKYRIEGRRGTWRESVYARSVRQRYWGECASGICALLGIAAAVVRHNWAVIPFLLLYVLGFAYVIQLGLWQSVQPLRH